jgi:hypothetical protein
VKLSRNEYRLKPLVIPAVDAHRNQWVKYLDDGEVAVQHPLLVGLGLAPTVHVPAMRQFPAVRATFDDLNKALSRLANSPTLDQERSLRQSYDDELARYELAVQEAQAEGVWEPDYGSYVFDHFAERLYLVAPEQWHRLALVTSNSKLCTDPEGVLSWQQIRSRLEGAVVGFAGLSVGGNVLEGWLREARPKRVKIADPDWLELTNFNRCERSSIRHVVASRAERFDLNNPYETPRIAKAEYVAYEHNLVDPYLEFHVYNAPLSVKNAEQFLLGDGDSEPRIDILVDEIDDFEMKIELRRLARQHQIDVLMLTDFGHRVHVMWNPFSTNPEATLGAAGNDARLLECLVEAKQGDRLKLFDCIDQLCRCDYRGDPFERFVNGAGEQPTGSIPQSGTTALIAGGVGGKELALRVLGRRRASETRGVSYDFLAEKVEAS